MSRVNLVFGALALACLATVIEGQLERCHTEILTPHHFLDLNRFRGRWYPLKLAPSKANQVYPLNFTCAAVDFLPTADKNAYDFVEYWTELETGIKDDLHSDLRLDEVARPMPAIWSIHYTDPESNEELISQSVVVAANEDAWALVYGCGVRRGELVERMTLWSRQRTLDPKIEKVLDTIAFGIGFRYENFRNISQAQC